MRRDILFVVSFFFWFFLLGGTEVDVAGLYHCGFQFAMIYVILNKITQNV
jgi:hypothetical protein